MHLYYLNISIDYHHYQLNLNYLHCFLVPTLYRIVAVAVVHQSLYNDMDLYKYHLSSIGMRIRNGQHALVHFGSEIKKNHFNVN